MQVSLAECGGHGQGDFGLGQHHLGPIPRHLGFYLLLAGRVCPRAECLDQDRTELGAGTAKAFSRRIGNVAGVPREPEFRLLRRGDSAQGRGNVTRDEAKRDGTIVPQQTPHPLQSWWLAYLFLTPFFPTVFPVFPQSN